MASEQNPQTASTKLRRMILSQSVSGTAVPIVLFDDGTLVGAETANAPQQVAQAAAELGIDLDSLTLFSHDAYRLQSALGERLAP